LGDVKVSPTTGNPLQGSPSWGYTDPQTGEFFTSDVIDGSINESESPLDYIGGFGLGKLLFKGAAKVGEKALAKLAAKKAAKKKAKCATCADATKESKELPKEAFKGDNPPPEGVNRDTPVFRGTNAEEWGPNGEHLGSADGTRYAFWNTSQSEGISGASIYGNPKFTTAGELIDNGVQIEPLWDNVVKLHIPESGIPAGTWKSPW
jgi:hypothetical protein